MDRRRANQMKLRLLVAAVVACVAAPAANAVTLPPGNAAQQWNKIAEDTIVGSGAFQGESFVYLAYVSAAMDGAVNPGERRGQSADAAGTQAAYDGPVPHFPSKTPGFGGPPHAAPPAAPARAAE